MNGKWLQCERYPDENQSSLHSAMGDGIVDRAKGYIFYHLESCMCEYESSAHVLLVSCGLIVDRAEPLRGLRWMRPYLNGCSHFTNEVCLANARR